MRITERRLRKIINSVINENIEDNSDITRRLEENILSLRDLSQHLYSYCIDSGMGTGAANSFSSEVRSLESGLKKIVSDLNLSTSDDSFYRSR